jgi:hypothetical protein
LAGFDLTTHNSAGGAAHATRAEIKFYLRSGVDVLIISFFGFGHFPAKMLAFFSKTNVVINF